MNAYTSIAQQIACRDFGKKTVNILSKKGVQFTGGQSAPLWEGDVYFGDTVYTVLIGGQVCAVRTYRQILAMANSSWTAKEFLQN